MIKHRVSRLAWCTAIGAAIFAGGWLPRSQAEEAAAAPPQGWEEVVRSANVVVYGKARPGSSIQELRGVGIIEAPNWVIKNVLDDTDHYAQFMPNILESRVLSRDAAHHTLVTYAKLSAPLISARDYTVLVRDQSHLNAEGKAVYQTHWEPANDKGPAEKPGVTRVKITDGSWLLEPAGDGQKTRATYQLYTDGGGLPAMILNQASKRRIGDLFEAVGARAKDAQYRKAKPTYP